MACGSDFGICFECSQVRTKYIIWKYEVRSTKAIWRLHLIVTWASQGFRHPDSPSSSSCPSPAFHFSTASSYLHAILVSSCRQTSNRQPDKHCASLSSCKYVLSGIVLKWVSGCGKAGNDKYISKEEIETNNWKRHSSAWWQAPRMRWGGSRRCGQSQP